MIKSQSRAQPTNEFDSSRLSEFAPLSSDTRPSGGFFSRWLRRPRQDENQKEIRSAPTTPSGSRRGSASSIRNEVPSAPLLQVEPPKPPTNLPLSSAVPKPDDELETPTSEVMLTPSEINANQQFMNSSRPSQANLAFSYSGASVPQSRTLSSVLRRLNSILDRKGMAYKDSDFKQYWMPDDTCNECYECNDKFTTFRRRHHCRICGQIFCSRCCNQEIPGRIFGYRGDLRVCTYCCRVVLSYAQQTDVSGDLRTLREDLKQLANLDSESGTYQEFQRWTPNRRKTAASVEEDPGRTRSSSLSETQSTANPFDITPQTEYRSMVDINNERRVLTKDSVQLRELWFAMQSSDDGLPMTSHRMRLRTYQNCFTGKDLIDWLLNQDRVTHRDQGVAIGQAMLDAKLIENVGGLEWFRDEYMLYRAGEASGWLDESQTSLVDNMICDEWEPMWTKEIKQMEDVIDAPSDDETLSVQSSVTVGSVMSRGGGHQDLYTNHFYHLKPDMRRQFSDISVGIRESVETQDAYPPYDLVSHRYSQDDLLSGAFGVDKESTLLEEPDWWKSVHPDQFNTDTTDKLAYDRLRKSHFEHLTLLVRQLLVKRGVSQQWAELILHLACHISEMVQPDVRGDDDDMDIRQYVQIKKIPGGHRKLSNIVHGAVFSKNVAHKKMRQVITSPRIMLLKNSIVFQRVENKFSSLEPQILQEKEYLKNCIAKVASFNPDVLLVEKTVSKLAKDFILESGISLIVNVKPSVMERVSRFTQADIISSIDGLVSRPRLGLCHTFKIQTFQLPAGTKSYAFFDGCATHLGCTVILRGGDMAELSKVKSILNLLVYGAYHARLETSYIMDENGLPPPCANEQPELESPEQEKNPETTARTAEIVTVEDNVETKLPENETKPRSDSTHPVLTSGSDDYTIVDASEDSIKRQRLRSLEMAALEDFEESIETAKEPKCDDSVWCDPLTVYQRTLDETVFHGEVFSVEVKEDSRTFKHYLEETILSVSPYIQYEVPYLLSEQGRQSTLRQYFPQQLYWSEAFDNNRDSQYRQNGYSKREKKENNNVELLEPHPFVVKPLIGSIFDKNNQSLMADYRARGGQIRVLSSQERQKRFSNNCNTLSLSLDQFDGGNDDDGESRRLVDCLNIEKHQRIAVLFSSYSYQSYMAPNPCISPWVVTMQYYGSNDMTLGNFLERLCFRESYTCPNEMCDTPMIDHIRKFVHEAGCIAVVLRKLDPTALSSNNSIVMWNWCRKCKKITPPVPISNETWSMSFAKYLELRFHGLRYMRRTQCDPPCQHSLHHEHYQYFGYKHTVAALKFMHISLKEVALPPLEIVINEDTCLNDSVLDETKSLAICGYGVYSKVLEYLCSLGQGQQDNLSDQQEQLIKTYHADLEMDRALFRQNIEQLQQLVTSRHIVHENGTSLHSSLTSYADDTEEYPDVCTTLFAINDQIVAIKRIISQTVVTWNNKIQELVNLHKKSKAKMGRDNTPPDSLILDSTELTKPRSRVCSSTTEVGEVAGVAGVAEEKEVDSDSVFGKTSLDMLTDSDHEPNPPIDDTMGSQSPYIVQTIVTPPTPVDFVGESDLPGAKFYFDTDSSQPVAEAEDALAFKSMSAVLVDENSHEDDRAIEEALHERVLHEPLCRVQQDEKTRTRLSSDADSLTAGPSRNGSELERSIEEAIQDTTVINASGSDDNLEIEVTSSFNSTSDSIKRLHASSDSKRARPASSGEEKLEKKTMKQILSVFLTGSVVNLLTQPYPPEEHHLLPPCRSVPVVVYDKEPSSIIAYALSSQTYETQRQGLKQQLYSKTVPTENSSPQLKRANIAPVDIDSPDRGGSRKKAVLSFFRSASSRDRSPVKASEVGGVQYTPSTVSGDSLELDDELRDDTDFAFYSVAEEKSKGPNPHIELQFSDSSAKFFCRIYYAQQFRQLRKLIFPAGEDRYIRSLSRCAPWMARGGKSGSYFCKTLDDRFVLKQMSRLEMQSFLEFAPNYFQYVTQTHAEQRPTVLAKIVGVYRIVLRNSQTNAATKQDLLVIENVFYGRKVAKRFDLKGSMRNRLVNTTGKREEELVLLDENLLKLIVDNPLYIRPHTKTVLTLAITNDTQFLSSHLVMDYSLLVGIDDNRKELVLGIIDYMRTFTWDKKLEMVVKSSGILGGQGKMPTVISPELYRTRFLEAMDSYFPLVPDRWSGLGQNVDN